MNIEIQNKDIFLKLVYFILLLLSANIIGIIIRLYFNHDYVHGLIPLFNFDAEKNIPTLYSSFTIIICSILLLVIALTHKKRGSPYFLWIGLAVIFLFLSIDEIASIHERLTDPVRETLNASGLLYFAWVIPYGIALVLFIAFYLKFLFALPKKIMILFIISGSLFVSGAIGFELLGGRYSELYGRDNLVYSVFYTCEELLEMLGIAAFIYTLLSYITSQFTFLTLTIKK